MSWKWKFIHILRRSYHCSDNWGELFYERINLNKEGEPTIVIAATLPSMNILTEQRMYA